MENSGHSYGDPGFGLADLDDSTPRPCAGTTSPGVLGVDNGRDHLARVSP